MKSLHLWARPCAAALLVAVLWVGMLAQPALGSTLSLDEALRLAEREAPSLAAQAANREAARSAAIPAGELPDPKLTLGLRNVPIEGETRWQLNEQAMTMQAIGLMQEVPNRAKRRARVEAAQAAVALADVQQQVVNLRVRQQAAEAWIAALSVERKLALFKQLYDENNLLTRAVTARIAGGSGSTADSVVPRQEAALLAEQEDQLLRNRLAARAALRRWVGDAAGQPLIGEWPRWPVKAAQYASGLGARPQLHAFDPMTRQAEAKVREAIADKRPDWSWGVDYQRREAFGDMVSLNVSFDLPLFAGSRQDPRIAAERARLSQIEAEREDALRAYRETLDSELAELQRLDRTLARLDATLLPLAEEKVRLALADYRGGGGALTAVVEARQQLVQTRLRHIEVARDRALANARLHFEFGETP